MKALRNAICGIDEAGRGPVFGPLVIAAFVAPREVLSELRAMGVKDSKLLSPSARVRAVAALHKLPGVFWLTTHISSEEIDMRRSRGESLNDIEASAMLVLAKRAHKDKGFDRLEIDSIELNTERFSGAFKGTFGSEVEVWARCKADVDLASCSAASIIAKTERDFAVERLQAAVGCDIGSGYPHDVVTRKFLEEYHEAHGKLPPFVRKSWKIKGLT